MTWKSIKSELPKDIPNQLNYYLVLIDGMDMYLCELLDGNIFMSNCKNHSQQCGSHNISFDEVLFWVKVPNVNLDNFDDDLFCINQPERLSEKTSKDEATV